MPTDPVEIGPRRDLLALVRAHPGMHLRELERASGLALGALRHHLDYLLAAGLIKDEEDGRLRRFYPVGLDPPLRKALAALRPRAHRAVVLHLLNHPGETAREVAAALSFPETTAGHYLRALAAAGIVARDRNGHRLAEPDAVVRALVAYRPSFADRLVDAALEIWFETE